MRRRDVALAIAIAGLGAIAIREDATRDREVAPPSIVLPSDGPLTVIAAGDVIVDEPLDASSLQAIRTLLDGAAVRVANLDMTLLDESEAGQAREPGAWPAGTSREARALRDLGLHVVSLANNHGVDFGPVSAVTARRILGEAGIEAAGAGQDLSEARAPVFVGGPSRRIAFLAVTTSAAPDARATDATSAIEGRPGVNALRYSVTITVDAATYRTLSQSLSALEAGPPAGPDSLMFFGTPIRRGERTVVEFGVDERDEEAMLAVIAAAHATAEVVLVSVHSHEPSNASEEPAAFVRRFARAAIDRGASLVFGHGPHRLRGVELYGRGAILYSLGNFVYPARSILGARPDMYDAGADLYEAAVSGGTSGSAGLALEDTSWWSGALALAVFEGGQLGSLRLVPLDLGADQPLARRGVPALARDARAKDIWTTIDRLSRPFDTTVDLETGQVKASPRIRP